MEAYLLKGGGIGMLQIKQNEAMIQNFDSLARVSPNQIIVQYKKYQVHIEGVDLKIKAFYKDEVYIGGQLLKVIFVYE